MESVKLPWQMGTIYSIFNKAVKVAVAGECPCSFEFNGVEVFVDENSIFSDKHHDRITKSVKYKKKIVTCYGE